MVLLLNNNERGFRRCYIKCGWLRRWCKGLIQTVAGNLNSGSIVVGRYLVVPVMQHNAHTHTMGKHQH